MPFITASNSDWEYLLKRCQYDIYHHPEYVLIQAEHIKGEALAWIETINGKSVLIPLIKRKIPTDALIKRTLPDWIKYSLPEQFDLQSPYGYPGILTNHSLNKDEINNLLIKYQHDSVESGYVSSFIRLNPFLNDWNISQTDTMNLKVFGEIVIISLEEQEAIGFSHNHKRNIERLKISGFKVQEDGIEYLLHFVRSYNFLMRKLKADEFYLFKAEYFSNLLSISGGKQYLITVLDPNNEYAAAGIFSIYGKVMQYQYGATSEKFKSLSPSKLMIEAACGIGRRSGASFLNLGGGYKASDNNGLYRFKKGFDKEGTSYKFKALQMIHRPSIYKIASGVTSTEFFPAYRFKNQPTFDVI